MDDMKLETMQRAGFVRRNDIMIGYKMTRPDCGGWMFLGVTPKEVGRSIMNEIENQQGLDIDECDTMEIQAFEVSKNDIDSMPDFPGW